MTERELPDVEVAERPDPGAPPASRVMAARKVMTLHRAWYVAVVVLDASVLQLCCNKAGTSAAAPARTRFALLPAGAPAGPAYRSERCCG